MNASRLSTLERRLTRERAYWLETLAGEPRPAELALDYARQPQHDPAKRTIAVPLEATDAEHAARISRGEPALALAFVTGAVAACLHRSTGITDIVVGTPVPDESPIAALNDLVPVRIAVPAARTGRELLAGARHALSGAFRHAKYPFERIVGLLALPAHANRTPLVSIAVAVEGLSDWRRADARPLDVVVSARLRNGRVEADVHYDPRLFAAATIQTFAAQLGRTMSWLATRSEAPLSGLTLMSDAERAAAVDGFNDTASAFPASPIHTLFEAQVDRTPDAIAARVGADALSYRDLDARANQLAHVLAESGVGAGSLVGILLAHSFDTLVAILGILKSGAAYVPLDPAHPESRIAATLADAQARLVVTTSDLASRVGGSPRTLALDAERARLRSMPAARPARSVSAGDLAYVIYTSGSTGAPKGVAIAHRSLVNYVTWAASAYVGGAARDFALHSSLAFDLTVTSIFVPLTTGGAVVAYRAQEGEPPIVDVLRDDRVDVVKLTPSHLALIAEQAVLPSRVRAFIVGGENLDTALARRIHERFAGRVAIFNEYGPTEATVGCMIHRFDPDRDRRHAVPIGVPAANTSIYVLDSTLASVPPNGIGELFIGGAGVADRYFGQPELTADRFLGDPFRSGGRMYRTGDLARRLPEGTIEFLGRNDDQVKVRGHRIDLNEVRHAVMEHAQVRDCAVRLLLDADGSASLVAYYVSRQPVDPAELRAFARERLVDAAVPATFAFLRRLPLTLNGKVNVHALPGLDAIRRQSPAASEPPRTPTERALADIWRALLRLDRVGVHDNFFELGGHSLIATQVVSRVREALGVELSLRSVFEQPTIAGLAARIDGTGVDGAAMRPIPPAARDRALPLSFAQQRLWFLDQLEPGSATYNIAARLQIDGALDAGALRDGINTIIARHESLRTTFEEDNGRPVQKIAARLEIELPLDDVAALPETARDRTLDEAATREATTPFDLRTGPLVRARLVRLGDRRHVLLLTLHHIVADGWSLGVFARELSLLYAARVEGRAAALPPLPVQYADFASWQRQELEGPRLTKHIAFWREALDGVPVIELPTDRARPAVQTFRGASLPVALPDALVAGVRHASVALGTTPFITLLAAYAALLHRWCGQTDVAIGSPIANRTRADLEPLIGFFANTLVLRVRLDGNPTLRELVERVKATVLDAAAHEELPFERLVDELQPERALSHNPLFQVMFGLHPAATRHLALPGLEFRALNAETGTAKFDLNLLLADDGDDVVGVIEYNTDLFDRSTIDRFHAQYETVVAAALANLDTRIGDLDVMPADERRRVLLAFNATDAPAPAMCMHEIVEAMVERSPDAIAVVFPGAPDETLTYLELNRRANRLAHYLRALGVGPDVPVGLCIDRSVEMAIAVLAVLKAGGAYVPLDPTYPRERLANMVEDARPRVLVAHKPTRDRVPVVSGSRVVWLDEDAGAIAGQPDTNPRSSVTADNLLYVIYTSGSTGRPKGIALPHRALTNLIQWHLDTIAEGRGVLQFASLSFDASFKEMFAAWAHGRYVAMIPEHWRRDPSELLAYLERWPVETAILPVVVLHQWAESQQQPSSALRAMRHLIATGEQLVITQSIIELFKRLPGCRLHNHYGPSETHVVTSFMLDDRPDTWPARPSIGRPIANSTIYILDPRLNPTPIGVTGELFIGGLGLARGYLNRPELTAAKFVPHPAPQQPGERLYATGDLARWSADGTIEFLGRRDDQVKIRGFRVELGDVESALNAHPDVSQNVVVVRDGAGGKRLVAYLVSAAGRTLTVDALRAFVQDRLPDYMVPSTFVMLEKVALTVNGKIDRRALPAPEEAPSERVFVAPNGPAEQLMAALWCEVLGVASVGSTDNFFHVGGHSLLATQLASRIRRTFEVALPLKAIFEAPTVAGLVDALGRAAGDRDVVDAIADAVRAVGELTPDEVRSRLAETPGGSTR